MSNDPTKMEIEACPFCGGRAVLEFERGLTFGCCSECGAEGPHCKTREEAITAWNTRATRSAEQPVEKPSPEPEVFYPSMPFSEAIELGRQELERQKREIVAVSLDQNLDSMQQTNSVLIKRLKTAIGGLCSIAYGEASTWPNCSSREVAKQTLLDCGGEKHPTGIEGQEP